MSLWESVKSTYADAVASALPLHRLALIAIGFIGAIAVRHQTHLSIVETISHLPLARFNFDNHGLLSAATVGDLGLGIALVALAAVLSQWLLFLLFAVAARSTELKARAVLAKFKVTTPLVDRRDVLEDLEKALEGVRPRLQRLNAIAESLAGFSIAAALFSRWGNALDAFCSVTSLLWAIGVQGHSVRVFLSDYMGPALLRAHLLGKSLPLPSDGLTG